MSNSLYAYIMHPVVLEISFSGKCPIHGNFKKLYKFSKAVDIIVPSHCLFFHLFHTASIFYFGCFDTFLEYLGAWVILFYSYYTFNFYCSLRVFNKEVLTRPHFFMNYYRQLMVARGRETLATVMYTLANGPWSYM